LSIPTLAQQFSSGAVNHHVCGNGTAGTGLGSGNCGAGSDPDRFDPAATTGHVVAITGTASVDRSLHGAYNSGSGNRAVEGNRVTINTTGGVDEEVTGGHAHSDDADAKAKDNRVDFILGALPYGGLWGGRASSVSGDAHADRNTLEMSDGKTYYSATGGSANSTDAHAQATRNSLVLSSYAAVGGSAHGGYASSVSGRTTAEENTLAISDDVEVGEDAFGAYAGGSVDDATARDNRLTISGNAKIYRDAAGAYVLGEIKATADQNTVVVSGGGVDGDGNIKGVAGGYAINYFGDATATKNKAEISGNTVIGIIGFSTADVYGGYANGDVNATAGDNEVEMSGGSVTGTLYGGLAKGYQSLAQAHANTIRLSGGTASEVRGGDAWSDQGVAEARGNVIAMSGAATVSDAVYGAYAEGPAATASGNTVEISGGQVENGIGQGLIGAYAHAQDAQYDAVASANTITVSGGLVEINLMGGFAEGAGVARSQGNIVTISGGEARGDILGGVADASIGAADAFATHNVVTLSGTPTLALAGLYGGIAVGGAGSDAFTGNTLNVKTSGLTVASLQNFEFLNFYLPTTLGNGQTMLIVNGTADLTDGGSRSATVSLAIDGASLPLQTGDYVVLIDASGGTLTGDPANSQASAHGTQGATLQYDFTLTTDANRLIATLDKASVREESQSISEGYLSGTALLAQGSGFLARQGVNAARDALRDEDPVRPGAFAALSGGQIRHETGSHVDVKGYTLITGFAQGFRTNAGDALLAGFFEYGKGDYTSHNSFASGKVKGQGDTEYEGIGLLGRFDFGNAAYVEGSLRGGRTETDYRSSDLRDAQDERVRYETRNGYLGAHLGGGKEWKLDEASALDTYAQALFTHQGADAVRLSTGDRVKFEAIDSKRLKAGARIKRAFSPSLTGYAGVAYDHEFSGKARATTGGQKIDAPSLKGGTGSVELGLTGRPSASHPLYLNFGIQGHAGKREGVTANFRVNYLF
jgi:outer membrane autotransporter protein